MLKVYCTNKFPKSTERERQMTFGSVSISKTVFRSNENAPMIMHIKVLRFIADAADFVIYFVTSRENAKSATKRRLQTFNASASTSGNYL